jgi:predicted DNA-binding ribbon-helix-helix protein
VDTALVGIYLNDHLAGSVIGAALARRIGRRNRDNEYGDAVAAITAEIEEDKRVLRGVMERLGVREKRTRLALAWLGEKGMRVKPNGRLVGYSPLSRVLELEGLVMGITGKLELWRSLGELEDASALREIDFQRLIARAEDQRERVEDLRIRAAREAFAATDGSAEDAAMRPPKA